MTIAEQLKKLRADRGLTQNDLAEAIGVGWIAVHHWETGERRPSATNIAAIEETFGIKLTS